MRRLVPLVPFALSVVACASAPAPSPTTTEVATLASSDTRAELEAALALPHRSEANRARDRYRHPLETLSFFGVRPDMTVLELAPGGGWYTEILAPFLRERGRLISAIPRVDSPTEFRRGLATSYLEQLRARADVYGEVQTATLETPDVIELGPDASVDAVLTFRNLHNWHMDGRMDEVLAAAFRVLRPGGVFGVVEHRAAEGATSEEGRTTGYLPEAWVIERATAAGFVFEASSDVNRNPADTHDHPNGVWSLPPTLRGGDEGREAFLAIGESDRMTLRFRKPDAR